MGKEGVGVVTYVHGDRKDRYEGEFKNDEKNGVGTYTWISGYWQGDQYSGQVRDDKIEGKGVYKTAYGDLYDGNFTNGQKDGYGVMRYAFGEMKYGNNTEYDGPWCYDQPTQCNVLEFKD